MSLELWISNKSNASAQHQERTEKPPGAVATSRSRSLTSLTVFFTRMAAIYTGWFIVTHQRLKMNWSILRDHTDHGFFNYFLVLKNPQKTKCNCPESAQCHSSSSLSQSSLPQRRASCCQVPANQAEHRPRHIPFLFAKGV